MKSIGNNLYRRGQTYYYRSALPRSLTPVLPFSELVFSLRNENIQEARLLSAQIKLEEWQLFETFWSNVRDSAPYSDLPSNIIQDLVKRLEALKLKYSPNRQCLLGGAQEIIAAHGKLPMFSEISKKYIEEGITDAHNTRHQKIKTCELFLDLVEDKPFASVCKEDARQFKEKLMKIPSKAKQLYGLENFKNIDWSLFENAPKQHPNTINNRLSYLVTFFNWGIKQGLYRGDNPFSNLMIRVQKTVANKRHPYNDAELKKLFLCPIYTGCQSEDWAGRFKTGHIILKDSLYWVPLIALYAGMRLNEICQLYVEDVKEDQSIFYFDVNNNGDDKSLKTSSSIRKVPIHKEILQHGFLDYLHQKKAEGHERLFPDIRMGCKKTYASTFSKRFTRLLRLLGLTRQGICFHSFRHTFIDGLRNAGVERQIAMIVTGHSSSKEVHDSYGYGYNLSVLHENINKLSFESIEK